MRCTCCNVNLNAFESTRKSATTGEYLDICNRCISGLGIETVDRPDLNPFEESNDDLDPYDGEGDVDPDFADDYNMYEEE
jgi:hypothetical protein